MSLQLKEIDNKSTWDTFVQAHKYGHLLQSWNWGEFKKPDWQPHRLGVYENDNLVGGAQLLVRVVVSGKTFIYCPRGPVIDPDQTNVLSFFLKEVSNFAASQKAFAVCFEPNYSPNQTNNFLEHGFEKGSSIQPGDTSIVDLNQTKEQLFENIHPKVRQGIRKAENSDVKFNQTDNIEDFLKVINVVRSRAKILMYPDSYYQKFWDLFQTDKKTYLFFARVSGEIDAGALAVGYGETLYALYGGPINRFPEVKANYLMKWKALETAKELGYKFYDQMGLAPIKDSSHNYAGVTVFKERFGGERRTYTGSFYLVLSRFWYYIYRAGPVLRAPMIRLIKIARR